MKPQRFRLDQYVYAPDADNVMRHCRVIRGHDQLGRYQLRVTGTGRNVGGRIDHNGEYKTGDVLVIYAADHEMFDVVEYDAMMSSEVAK